MVFASRGDNPEPTPISINNTVIEQVTEYKYVGTAIPNKLKFATNTERLVGYTRHSHFIMRKIRYMGTTKQLAVTCYKAFIESSLLYTITFSPTRIMIWARKHNQLLTNPKQLYPI